MGGITSVNVPRYAVSERANVVLHNAANLPHKYRERVLNALTKAESLDSEVQIICDTQGEALAVQRTLNPDFRIAIESESEADVAHIVSGNTVNGSIIVNACTCKDFLFRPFETSGQPHECKHIKQAKGQMAVSLAQNPQGLMLGER